MATYVLPGLLTFITFAVFFVSVCTNSSGPNTLNTAPNSDFHEVLRLISTAGPLVHQANTLLTALSQCIDEIHSEADWVDQAAHDLEQHANNRSKLESLIQHTFSLYLMASESEPTFLETHNITVLDGEPRVSIWIDFAKSLSYSARFLETAMVKQIDGTHQTFRAISDTINNLTQVVKRLKARVPNFNITQTITSDMGIL